MDHFLISLKYRDFVSQSTMNMNYLPCFFACIIIVLVALPVTYCEGKSSVYTFENIDFNKSDVAADESNSLEHTPYMYW